MGRPVIPQAVRRVEVSSAVEVCTKGGQWLTWRMLSDASRQATIHEFRAEWQAADRSFPPYEFMWDHSVHQPAPQEDERQPVPQQQQVPQDDREQDAPDDDKLCDSYNDDDNNNDDIEQEQSPIMSIEDIVRQIAGQLDDDLWPQVLDQVKVDTEHRFKTWMEENPVDPHRGGTTRIEVRTPTISEDREGLFHREFPELLSLIAIGQHTFLPGPPGAGKTHAAKQAAEVMGWRYAEMSMSPDMPESRMWGGRTPGKEYVETPLLEGLRWAQDNPDNGLVYLFDEMDNARASSVVGINAAAANCRVTAPNGDEITWDNNVTFIGAANTFGTGPTAEFAGRFKIDAATIDRFAYIPWDTDTIMEESVVRSYLHADDALATAWLDAWRTLRSNVVAYGIKTFVTMRGAKNGARMLASGAFTLDRTMMLVAGNKLPADQWSKVNPL